MRVVSCYSALPCSFAGHMLTNLKSIVSNIQHVYCGVSMLHDLLMHHHLLTLEVVLVEVITSQ